MKEEERTVRAQWWDMNALLRQHRMLPQENLVWVQRRLMRGSRNSFPRRKRVFKFREETGASRMGNAKQQAIQSRQTWRSRLFLFLQ